MPASKSSGNIKLRKKLKLANCISKDDKKTLDSNGKGANKAQQNREQVYEGVVNGKSGGKRKRVYAHRDMDNSVGRRYLLKEEGKMVLEAQEKFSRKNALYGEGRRSLSNERKSRNVKVDGYGEEENVKRKTLDQSGSNQKSPRRSSTKNNLQRPKKKKRVIRIDPHDTSNKRLDDGLPSKDNNKEKQEESAKQKTVELSKNAQFRSICPSPSILSFVEDNLLGRRRDIQLKRAGYNIELSAPLDNIPFSTSSERKRIEGPVFRNKLEFFAAAKVLSSFPPADLPEIAFAGRSNVGKSSLLNALTRQWGVVRTSDKPGLTQTINFFKLGSKMCLVDLPGYGFAYAKEEVKEAWEELVKEYVSTRLGLKRVCLLIDTKWGMKQADHELINLMERAQTKYQIILTKTDTVFPIDVARRAMQIEESLKANKSVVQPAVMVSSKSGAGIRSLRTVLAKIARFVKP
ncbi:uncharacterized protein LOC132636049 [Lycium barbarum]|uniref:uncharacterized protein LOC132636049 n=1 Tax=Lycium barbarum TaxID=112863 RepID=UPI00293E0C89|nr:uncharacterized protein LOC132636049 [Lycium barbarum]XP_060208698.1 uncharacterized protein LOC132636049 [Lycium barbarum]XP_060208699.1 uncharacterized protein LOC132636049 [Lycium barbarum]